MATFISNVPIWVLPLFIVLFIVGLRASKNRSVPILLIYLLPLLGLLTLPNITSLAPPIWLWTFAAVTYASGIAIGMRLQHGWIVARYAQFAQVKCEWATMTAMTAMMIVFAAGFVNGFLGATMPALSQTAVFLTGFVAINCLASGQFLGRAITALRTPVNQS